MIIKELSGYTLYLYDYDTPKAKIDIFLNNNYLCTLYTKNDGKINEQSMKGFLDVISHYNVLASNITL